MALVCKVVCDGVIIDVYDSERIPIGTSQNKYYLTPSMLPEIKEWLKINNLEKIMTVDHIESLLSVGLVGEYKSPIYN